MLATSKFEVLQNIFAVHVDRHKTTQTSRRRNRHTDTLKHTCRRTSTHISRQTHTSTRTRTHTSTRTTIHPDEQTDIPTHVCVGEYIRSLRSPVFTGAIQISILLYFTLYTSTRTSTLIYWHIHQESGRTNWSGSLISLTTAVDRHFDLYYSYYSFCWNHYSLKHYVRLLRFMLHKWASESFMNELYNLYPSRDARSPDRSCFFRSVLTVGLGCGQLLPFSL